MLAVQATIEEGEKLDWRTGVEEWEVYRKINEDLVPVKGKLSRWIVQQQYQQFSKS